MTRRTMSLRNKIIISFVCLVAFSMLVLNLLIFSFEKDRQRKEYLANNEAILSASANNISFQLRQILELTLTPYMDDQLFKLLVGKSIEKLEMSILEGSLYAILNSNSDITQVQLYIAETNEGFVAKRYNISRNSNLHGITDCGQNVTVAWQPRFTYGIPFSSNAEEYMVAVSRNLYNYPKGECIGNIQIDVRSKFFTETNSIFLSEDNGIIACLSEEGNPIFVHPDGEEINSIIANLDLSGESGSKTIIHQGNPHTVIYHQLSPGMGLSPLYLAKIINNADISKGLKDAGRRMLAIGVVTMVAALLLITIVASKFLEPFKYIEDQLGKVAKGNLNINLDLKSPVEFQRLGSQFNSMIDTINNVVIQNYRLELENKNNQLKALQAQLNPHFVNNTLQTIGSEALKKGNMDVYRSILHFGEMMRYIMNFSDMSISFKEEVEYTQNYLRLQKMRLGERLIYTFDVADNVLAFKVPRLVLQPLVENSIKHGYGGNSTDCVDIHIHASKLNGRFILTCTNSGRGLSKADVSTLRESLQKAREYNEETNDIGLRNLARRLQLLYGSDATLNIESEEGKGFSVMLEFPFAH